MAGNTTNFTLVTDFNTNPYYDDFDRGKGFYRILFKPSIAVQARELTQIQTYLQSQIDKFAEHIFKEGSLVSGGLFNLDTNVDYVKINDLTSLGANVNLTNLVGQTMTGATTGVQAYVIHVEDGSEGEDDKKTLFVRYTKTGSDTTTKVFAADEILTSSGGNAVVYDTDPTGKGSMFTIDQGVVFSKDHFIDFPRQQIVLERYSQTPSYRVGFDILETIVTATTDATLNDPALGAYNYAAPGADRLKLTADLVKNEIDDPAGPPNFVEMFIVRNGVLERSFERTQYSLIRNELARRTSDESGSYYVRGLNVRIREHLDDGENQGLYPSPVGNSDLLVAGVEPGLAYINGYDIETLVTKYVNVRKATDYEHINNQISTTRMGNYVRVKELCGSWDVNSGDTIWLFDTAQTRLTSQNHSSAAQTGAALGKAKLRGIEHVSGVVGTPSAEYNVYLFDVQMSNGAFSSVKSLYKNNSSTADIGADVVLSSGVAVLNETSYDSSIYNIGATSIRAIRDESDNVDASFEFKKSFSISIASGGTFTINTGAVDETFPYSVGALTDVEKEDIIISLDAAATKTMSGTVSTFSNTTVTGSSTNFTRLNVGDKVSISDVSGTYYIASIDSDTSMKLTTNAASSAAGKTLTKEYKIGDIVDFTGKGADAGTDRTVTLNSSTSMSFDMKETLSGTTAATATLKLTKTTARETAKLLRASRYVHIDCSTAGTAGPFNLGFSDVYQIRSIRKKTGTFSNASEGTDVTSQFSFDNGQRDHYYGHASITPLVALTATDDLLIELDYFESSFTQGLGYFSIDSYPIDDTTVSSTSIMTKDVPVFTSPTTGATYDLRNCLDFRVVKSNTASDATTVGAASTNPATTDSFTAPSGGLHFAVPNGSMTYDYSYYQARKDLVIMDETGVISVVEGNPATVPITPSTPPTSMALATLTIAPYPSLSPANALAVSRKDLSCLVEKTAFVRHTMRDIGVLKERIENLEYYSALSLLEKQASDLAILDENGLDRFKNGIFVDTFRDHSQGAVTNADYKIVVDPQEESIRPQFDMESVPYDYLSGSNVRQSNNLITLNYTETELITQPYATTTRNVNTFVYNFTGLLTLNPETDVWVDTVQLPDTTVGQTTPPNLPPMQTEWGAWQTNITGYRLYNNRTGRLLATVDTQEEANRRARSLSTIDVRIEQFGTRTREGTTSVPQNTGSLESLGNKVVDVSIIPYIRPQIIELSARDLKPNTRLYTYIDDEDMTDYVTPANTSFDATDSEGANWVSGEDGKAYGLLRIPQDDKKFRIGTKKIRVSDNPTNEEETTTSAIAYFVAQGLIQQKQETILSTYQTNTGQTDVSETTSFTSSTVINARPIVRRPQSGANGGDRGSSGACLGYSFFVDVPDTEEGVFVTSFDLYFADTHATHGAWFELRKVDNAGGITNVQVPYSVVYIDAADITTSDDGSVPQRIYFQCPIFLYNKTEYALIIHAIDTNPDTYVWVAQLGDDDTVSGNPVVSRKNTGTLYDTNNNRDYQPIPNTDLKFTLYRADFEDNVTGTANFGNKPFEKFKMASVSSTFDHYGEKVRGQTRLTITSNTSDISVGNYIIGGTSTANSQIQSIDGTVYTMTANTIQTYVDGETVTIKTAGGTTRGTATISAIAYPRGTLYNYRDVSANTIHVQLRDTTDNWEDDGVIVGEMSGDYGVIDTRIPIKYSVVDFEPNYLKFSATSISFAMKGTSNTNNLDSSSIAIEAEGNNFFVSEKHLLGKTDETDLISGSRSNQVAATMSTTSPYVSPVIDLNRTHSVFVHNVINANTSSETAASGGAAQNKYISKTITLADGQDAEDLKIYISGYQPPGTEIKVYAKIANAEDADSFDSHSWVEMEVPTVLYSSISNKNDWIEMEFSFPDDMMTGLNGAVEYTNSAGVDFSGFKQFAVKVVLASSNSALVPRVADLRLIALQM